MKRKYFTDAKLLIPYAFKMLTKPIGTTYELKGKPVNRFVYTYGTIRMMVDHKYRRS